MTSLPPKVLFSGASGMIGSALVRAAADHRIHAVQLVRHEPADPTQINWNPQAPDPISATDLVSLEGITAAVHLSGANLSAHRWTPAYKREIVDSRVGTTRALVTVLKSLKYPPAVFLCASATGVYGDRGDEILTETSEPGRGFLPETCLAWETEAARAGEAGIRVVLLRFGVVLDREAGAVNEGGALKQMMPIFRLGLGGKLGSGRQWMSWIALGDMVRAIYYLRDSPAISGPVNLVAPNPVTNAEFTRALGHALHRPTILPVPAFALRLAFGEIADEALLASSRAIPDRLLSSGFRFDRPGLDGALAQVLANSSPRSD